MLEGQQFQNLPHEVEARWRLVETAWKLNISRHLIAIDYDDDDELLFVGKRDRRTDITSCRDALNGYQRGKCFYSDADISIEPGAANLADVDHFFPRVLAPDGIANPIDGVWNLVLASKECNRGEGGKFDRLPHRRYLERLYQRNEYFVSSHHPLRETIMCQTGFTSQQRQRFLQQTYMAAESGRLINSYWEAPE